MKTPRSRKQYSGKAIYATLLILEEQRKIIRKKLIKAGIVLSAIFLAISIVLLFFPELGGGIFIAAVICFIIWGFMYVCLTHDYKAEFKDKIIKRIIHSIDNNLTYEKDSYIPKETFNRSDIFRKEPTFYYGDDLVFGKVGETEISFSEISTNYKGGLEKYSTEHITFKGLFFVAEFNKHFEGKTFVLPDIVEKKLGRVGKKLQSLNKSRGKLIKLENSEFEKHFVVYGSDQIEARYILSTSLMERITDFKKASNRDIYLSFVGSKIYIAISYNRNLFEPSIFKTLLDFEPIQEYRSDLRLATGIVDDLNLNTRIWTKR